MNIDFNIEDLHHQGVMNFFIIHKARSDVLRKTPQPGLFFTHVKNAAS